MIPKLAKILDEDPTVRNLLGEKPMRLFPWGRAPEKINYPYATYGVVTGLPENYLGQLPDTDKLGTQVDVWAESGASCEAVAVAIRDVLEPLGHMTRIGNMERDKDTGSYRLSMDFDLYTFR